jgi:putative phosphoesterase
LNILIIIKNKNMKIGLISDVHDQIHNLQWALSELEKQNIDYIFALGDYTSSYMIERLQLKDVPVRAVWGNCDGDKQSMLRASHNENPHITFANGVFDTVEIENKKYFLTHFPDLAENAAKSLDYDAVFHGHTHHKRDEKIEVIPIVNPGKLAIYPHDEISCAVFDTQTQKVNFLIK